MKIWEIGRERDGKGLRETSVHLKMIAVGLTVGVNPKDTLVMENSQYSCNL